jgi:sodium transport system permease protein
MILAVLRKELRDQIRDRRALLGNILPMIMTGPLMFVVIFVMISGIQEKTEHFSLPVLHAERAEPLMVFLRNQNVKIFAAPSDYEQQLRDGKLDVVLSIPEDFAETFREARPAEVELIQDSSHERAQASVRRLDKLLRSYSLQTGVLRLMMRGISPDVVQAVKSVDTDLATAQQRGAPLMIFLSIYAVLSLVIGAMHVSIDMTSGERERGSLEPLLLNPVPTWQLMTGKWATAALFSLAAALLFILSFYLPIHLLPLHKIDLAIIFGFREVALAVLALVPLSFPLAALLQIIGLFAKTHKEAQTYATFLTVGVSLLPLTTLVNPMKPALELMPVPVLAQNLLLTGVTRGDPLPWTFFALSAASCIVLTALLLAVAARLAQQERIVFGR